MSARAKLAAVAVGAVLVAGATGSHGHHIHYAYAKGHPGVVAFARDHLGCPYVWGGTGPCSSGFDCSGLAMEAAAAAGITIPRTSEEQWLAGRRVQHPKPGDLVFFTGADGSWSAPGHVGIVIGHGLMIDAPHPGAGVRVESYDWPDLVGFTDPGA